MLNNVLSKIRAVYEILSKNVVEPEKPLTIWRRVVCWTSKATRAQAHTSTRELKRARTQTHTY